ncbi:MAG: hypothetical protein ACQCN6_01115 [Candidatus Bathyarchaeia archaeon]|jgi:hypothetical protein
MSKKKQAAQLSSSVVVATVESFDDVPPAKRKEQAKETLYITRI